MLHIPHNSCCNVVKAGTQMSVWIMLHIPHGPCCNVAHHESRSLNVRLRHNHVSASRPLLP